jgi:hypothetical protein
LRTDIQRVKQITKEMKINDLLYDEMKEEYDCYISGLHCLDPNHISEAMELLYFHRRMLSVLSAQDLPLRSAIGLFSLDGKLMKIEAQREQYIGDSDTDNDIYSFLMELGYRIYDLITPVGTTAEEMYEKFVAR